MPRSLGCMLRCPFWAVFWIGVKPSDIICLYITLLIDLNFWIPNRCFGNPISFWEIVPIFFRKERKNFSHRWGIQNFWTWDPNLELMHPSLKASTQTNKLTYKLSVFRREQTFQHGITINLLWQIISNPTQLRILSLCLSLYRYWNVNPKTQKMLYWKYGIVLDCFNRCEIGLNFPIQHFWSHWITSVFFL